MDRTVGNSNYWFTEYNKINLSIEMFPLFTEKSTVHEGVQLGNLVSNFDSPSILLSSCFLVYPLWPRNAGCAFTDDCL